MPSSGTSQRSASSENVGMLILCHLAMPASPAVQAERLRQGRALASHHLLQGRLATTATLPRDRKSFSRSGGKLLPAYCRFFISKGSLPEQPSHLSCAALLWASCVQHGSKFAHTPALDRKAAHTRSAACSGSLLPGMVPIAGAALHRLCPLSETTRGNLMSTRGA